MWVVTFGDHARPFTGYSRSEQAFLRAHYRVAQVTYPSGMTVALLVRR